MDQNFEKFNKITSILYNYKLIDSKSPITKCFISQWIVTAFSALTNLCYSTLYGYTPYQRVKWGNIIVGFVKNAEIVNFSLFCINLNHNMIILLSIYNSYVKPRDHQYFLDFLGKGFLSMKIFLQNLILRLFWLIIVNVAILGATLGNISYEKINEAFKLSGTEKLLLITVCILHIFFSMQIISHAYINSVTIAIICNQLKAKFSTIRMRFKLVKILHISFNIKLLLQSFNHHCSAIKKLDKTMKYMLFTTIGLAIPYTGIFLLVPITSNLPQMITFLSWLIPIYFGSFISALMICCASVNNQVRKIYPRLCSLVALLKNRQDKLKLILFLKRFSRLEQLTMNDIPITYRLYSEVIYQFCI